MLASCQIGPPRPGTKPQSHQFSSSAAAGRCNRLAVTRATRAKWHHRPDEADLDRLLHWGYMHPDLTPLEHEDELHRLLAASEERPILLFKHSHSCGVSMEALDELVAHMNDRPGTRGAERSAPQYAMVTVQTHRAVSNAVAQKLGVRHETPQALLIRDGRVVWSASHFRVTAAAVDAAIRTRS